MKYRKTKGVSIGIPPFGTIRDDQGYLMRSPHGAWFMPDCSFVAGKEGDPAPAPDAVWRSYFKCAEAILKLYKENLHGYDYIADKLNEDGWAFRDRWNKPRTIKLDDVRRVVSNWREYAGMVTHGRAKEKIADQLDSLHLCCMTQGAPCSRWSCYATLHRYRKSAA